MADTSGAEQQYWTLMLTGIPKVEKTGQDQPLVDEIIDGIKPSLVGHFPKNTSTLFVVVKGLSKAFEAQKWLYRRKLKNKFEVLSGLIGTVGFATALSGDFGAKIRYRAPELTDEAWQQAAIAELQQPESTIDRLLPSSRAGHATSPTVEPPPAFASSANLLPIVRTGKNPTRLTPADANIERQLAEGRLEISTLETEIQQLYSTLATQQPDPRQTLDAQRLKKDGLVLMRDFLRARMGLAQADPEDIPSRTPLDFVLEDVPIGPGTSVRVRQTGEFFKIEPDADRLVVYQIKAGPHWPKNGLDVCRHVAAILEVPPQTISKILVWPTSHTLHQLGERVSLRVTFHDRRVLHDIIKACRTAEKSFHKVLKRRSYELLNAAIPSDLWDVRLSNR